VTELYIGLMSGTSLDGVDGVLVGFDTPEPARFRVLGHAHRPFEPRLAAELLALNTAGADELHRGALAANALARLYASVVLALREAAGVSVKQVRAIGAHGQTVRHRPGEFDGTGYTVQLNNPALLAELIGIDVIADLRSRDLAAGGQGAPLVPAFHRAVFGHVGESLAVLNLGGIGNLTALRADGSTTGFDCGPGNTLLDLWCLRHTGRPFDDHGAWAASGCVDPVLLAAMQLEPFFAMPPPKSTGRDLFNAGWLDRLVAGSASTPEAVDVQATLVELTTAVCVDAVNRHAADTDTLLRTPARSHGPVDGHSRAATVRGRSLCICVVSPGIRPPRTGEPPECDWRCWPARTWGALPGRLRPSLGEPSKRTTRRWFLRGIRGGRIRPKSWSRSHRWWSHSGS
jgi:anhydro-N-acetylmuramic acid kinase